MACKTISLTDIKISTQTNTTNVNATRSGKLCGEFIFRRFNFGFLFLHWTYEGIKYIRLAPENGYVSYRSKDMKIILQVKFTKFKNLEGTLESDSKHTLEIGT